MYQAVTPTEMRHVVLDAFQQHCELQLSAAEMEERVRVEDGRVVAYCYRAENLFAMWMVPIGLVQFYDDQGNMLQTLELTAPAISRQRAA
jgi:hypothetical protein